MPRRKKKKYFPGLRDFGMKLGGLLAAKGIAAWMQTLDTRAVYYDRTVDPVEGIEGPRIYVFWHEYILLPLALRGHCHLSMLLSQHGDADILARIAGHFGFGCVRGSTYRGGARALWELEERSRTQHLTITPDGPRGPRRQLAQGPIYLASRLQIPIVPMGFGYNRPWRSKSWDRFAVPRIFSRARAVVGPAIKIPADLDRTQLETCRLRTERLLNCLTAEAEAWAAAGSRKAGEIVVRNQPAPPPPYRGAHFARRTRVTAISRRVNRRRTAVLVSWRNCFTHRLRLRAPPVATPTLTAAPQTLTVSELTARIKDLLEGGFPSVWVSGEISNFSRPQSGHCYFTLKDDVAQIRTVVWRGAASKLKFNLADGLDVLCRGHLDVYAPRGSYQLVVDEVEPKGVGALELALRKLREKLSAEGLFDPARKRKLPVFPKRLAFVTSPTGAAVRDFLEVLRRRWRGVDVLIIPARVQGEGSAAEIVVGIRTANRLRPAPDVLVVGRGGGSLEDLWSFNEETVVRAIAASKIPTVSAVGHEIDVTLADLVADVRALTPSEAAERVVPDAEEIAARLRHHRERLRVASLRRLTLARTRLEGIASQRPFRRPFDIVHDRSRRLDELAVRGGAGLRGLLHDRQRRFANLAGKLQSLSPLSVLERGYTITQDAKSGKVIRNAVQARTGQAIATRFSDGTVVSRIDEINLDEK